MKRNCDIRDAKGWIPNWVLAERLGIHENTLYYKLRKELSEHEKEIILRVIAQVKEEFKDGKV